MKKTVSLILAALFALAPIFSASCGKKSGGETQETGVATGQGDGVEIPISEGEEGETAHTFLKLENDRADLATIERIIIGFEKGDCECEVEVTGSGTLSSDIEDTSGHKSMIIYDGRFVFIPQAEEAGEHEPSLSYITAVFREKKRKENRGLAFISVENDGWGVSTAKILYQCAFTQEADISDYYVERRFVELSAQARREHEALPEAPEEDIRARAEVLPAYAFLYIDSVNSQGVHVPDSDKGYERILFRFDGGTGVFCRFSDGEFRDALAPSYEAEGELAPGGRVIRRAVSDNNEFFYAVFYDKEGIVGFAVKLPNGKLAQRLFPLVDGGRQAVTEEYVARRAREIYDGGDTVDIKAEFRELSPDGRGAPDIFSVVETKGSSDGVSFRLVGDRIFDNYDYPEIREAVSPMIPSRHLDTLNETSSAISAQSLITQLSPSCTAFCDVGDISYGSGTLLWKPSPAAEQNGRARVAVVFRLCGIPVSVSIAELFKKDGAWHAERTYIVVFPRSDDGSLCHVTDEITDEILASTRG